MLHASVWPYAASVSSTLLCAFAPCCGIVTVLQLVARGRSLEVTAAVCIVPSYLYHHHQRAVAVITCQPPVVFVWEHGMIAMMMMLRLLHPQSGLMLSLLRLHRRWWRMVPRLVLEGLS